MRAEKTLSDGQAACYTFYTKMNQEAMYQMISIERYLNPSAPLWAFYGLGFLICLSFLCCLTSLGICIVRLASGDGFIRGSLIAVMVFLSITFVLKNAGPGFLHSRIFGPGRGDSGQCEAAWKRFLIKNGEPLPVTYLFYKDYFRTSGGRTPHAYSGISRICETDRCLVLYTNDHGGYLLDKGQLDGVSISGLRDFLSERTGKTVKWIAVGDYIPVKSN